MANMKEFKPNSMGFQLFCLSLGYLIEISVIYVSLNLLLTELMLVTRWCFALRIE